MTKVLRNNLQEGGLDLAASSGFSVHGGLFMVDTCTFHTVALVSDTQMSRTHTAMSGCCWERGGA